MDYKTATISKKVPKCPFNWKDNYYDSEVLVIYSIKETYLRPKEFWKIKSNLDFEW